MTSPPRTTASGLLIGGEWVEGGEPLAVLDKYSGETVAELRAARPDDIGRYAAQDVTDPRIVVPDLAAPGPAG